MRFYFLFAALTVALFSISSCGDIQQTSTVKTEGMQVGRQLVAVPGDAVLKVIKQESLPNAFGGADIFGRKRPSGTTSLIFVGGNGSIANFVRRDVDIQSDKTTMNSTPIILQNSSETHYSGNIGMTRYSGTATTRSTPIFLPPNTPADMISGVREIQISVPTAKGRNSISIGGRTLIVMSATSNQLTYALN